MKGLIFTLALAYGGGVVSLFRPFYGFLIYVAFAIIKPESLWHWAVPQGNYSRIIAIALLIGWAIAGCGNWQLGRGKAPVVALLLFWACATLGAFHAPDQDLAMERLEGLSKTFLPMLVGLSLIDSVKQLRQLAWVILISQGYIAFEFNLTYLDGAFSPDGFMFGGLDNNGLAITMVTGIGLGFFLGLQAERWWMKGAAFALTAFMVHFVLFSMSRGGVIALILTSAVSFFLIPKRTASYFLFAGTIAVTLWFMGPEVRARFASSFASEENLDGSANMRMKHWNACWTSMQKTPLGIGTANWPMESPRYGLPAMAAHSTWLQVGAELGFPGLFSLLGFYLLIALRLLPLARGKQAVSDPWLQYLARMVLASIVGFVVSAQFVSLEGAEIPYYVALLGIGVPKMQSTSAKDGCSSDNDEPGIDAYLLDQAPMETARAHVTHM
jgi:putative inorganic carbon (hco3(-)) transporter